MRRTLSRSLMLALALAALSASPAFAAGKNWAGYLAGPQHNSFSRQTAITPANAASLVQRWNFLPPAGPPGAPGRQLTASPTVVGSRVYIGANTGDFYALNLRTGKVVWHQFLGFVPALTCNKRGITSSATVVKSPATGRLTVYVAGGAGTLYALDAATGDIVWTAQVGSPPSQTVNDYYDWASPIVFGGHVYMGVASQCDAPYIQGGLQQFDQATGALDGSFWTVPDGSLGGGVWASPSEQNGTIYIGTGSAPPNTPGDSMSVISIDPATMTKIQSWQLPADQQIVDSDFGASPTLFNGILNGKKTAMVAECNKNGTLYAFKQHKISAGPVWQFAASAPSPSGNNACLTAPAFDGTHLFVASAHSTLGDQMYEGVVREVDPATGTSLWATPIGAGPITSPSLDAGGVIAVSSWDVGPGITNGTYLLDAATGAVLTQLVSPTASYAFSQPGFAGSYLLVATVNDGLTAYSP